MLDRPAPDTRPAMGSLPPSPARRSRGPAARLGAARAGLLAVAALALALGGCMVHARPAPVHPHAKARVVVVPKGHVHSHRCGHYRHGGHWYHLAGHLHRRGCGHVFVGGVWVVGR